MTTKFKFICNTFIINLRQLSLYNVVTTNLMMFIRSKRKGSQTYYWIVECMRIGKKVVQKPLRYIGTAESLLAKLEELDKHVLKKG